MANYDFILNRLHERRAELVAQQTLFLEGVTRRGLIPHAQHLTGVVNS